MSESSRAPSTRQHYRENGKRRTRPVQLVIECLLACPDLIEMKLALASETLIDRSRIWTPFSAMIGEHLSMDHAFVT